MSTKPTGHGESILTMPPEIQAMFADNLEEKSDLQSLRLSSRALCAAAAKPFARYFEHRRHIVSPHSLKTLVEIAAHPLFGPVIKTVSLGTAAVAKTSLLSFIKHHKNEWESYTMFTGDADAAFSFVQDHIKWQTFIDSTQPLALLCKALHHIKAHGTTLILGLFDDDLRYGYGSDEYYASLRTSKDSELRRENPDVTDVRRSGKVLELLFAAAENANCPVQGLHFVADVWVDDDERFGRMFEEGLFDALKKTILTKKSSLKTGMSLEIHSGYECEPHKHIARCADGALELTRMGLCQEESSYSTIDKAHLGSMASAFKQEAYRSIVFHDCCFQVPKLEAFLSRSQQTLASIHIHSLLLADIETDRWSDTFEDSLSSWVKILRHLRSTFPLQDLFIEFPADCEALKGRLGDLHGTQHAATGKEEVGTLLEDLIWHFEKMIVSNGT